MKYLATVVFALLLSSCGGGGGGGGGTNNCGALNARIFNGETCSQTAQTPVVALGIVLNDGRAQLFCTGTLVTVDDILTSAHCLDQLIAAAPSIAAFGVIVGGSDGQALPVVRAAQHPRWIPGNFGSPFDVAMLTLAEVPTPPIAPLPILLSELTGPGSEITAFGYGTTEAGIQNTLKAATFTVSLLQNGNLVVTAGNSNNSSVCPGDSGGPAVYRTQDGTASLAGVNSYIARAPGACVSAASQEFGFVDIQNSSILNFMADYAPDIPAA